jgi:hypothetical protein
MNSIYSNCSQTSPPRQFGSTLASVATSNKSVMLGSCCCTDREARSWLRRSVASLSPRRPGFDPKPVCVICGRRSGTGSGFCPNIFCFPLFRFFPPILHPHKNNMCYVLTILFVIHVLWHLYTGSFFLCLDTTTYSVPHHDSNGRESGCTRSSAVQLMWCFYCPFVQNVLKVLWGLSCYISLLVCGRAHQMVSKCVQHVVVSS